MVDPIENTPTTLKEALVAYIAGKKEEEFKKLFSTSGVNVPGMNNLMEEALLAVLKTNPNFKASELECLSTNALNIGKEGARQTAVDVLHTLFKSEKDVVFTDARDPNKKFDRAAAQKLLIFQMIGSKNANTIIESTITKDLPIAAFNEGSSNALADVMFRGKLFSDIVTAELNLKYKTKVDAFVYDEAKFKENWEKLGLSKAGGGGTNLDQDSIPVPQPVKGYKNLWPGSANVDTNVIKFFDAVTDPKLKPYILTKDAKGNYAGVNYFDLFQKANAGVMWSVAHDAKLGKDPYVQNHKFTSGKYTIILGDNNPSYTEGEAEIYHTVLKKMGLKNFKDYIQTERGLVGHVGGKPVLNVPIMDALFKITRDDGNEAYNPSDVPVGGVNDALGNGPLVRLAKRNEPFDPTKKFIASLYCQSFVDQATIVGQHDAKIWQKLVNGNENAGTVLQKALAGTDEKKYPQLHDALKQLSAMHAWVYDDGKKVGAPNIDVTFKPVKLPDGTDGVEADVKSGKNLFAASLDYARTVDLEKKKGLQNGTAEVSREDLTKATQGTIKLYAPGADNGLLFNFQDGVAGGINGITPDGNAGNKKPLDPATMKRTNMVVIDDRVLATAKNGVVTIPVKSPDGLMITVANHLGSLKGLKIEFVVQEIAKNSEFSRNGIAFMAPLTKAPEVVENTKEVDVAPAGQKAKLVTTKTTSLMVDVPDGKLELEFRAARPQDKPLFKYQTVEPTGIDISEAVKDKKSGKITFNNAITGEAWSKTDDLKGKDRKGKEYKEKLDAYKAAHPTFELSETGNFPKALFKELYGTSSFYEIIKDDTKGYLDMKPVTVNGLGALEKRQGIDGIDEVIKGTENKFGSIQIDKGLIESIQLINDKEGGGKMTDAEAMAVVKTLQAKNEGKPISEKDLKTLLKDAGVSNVEEATKAVLKSGLAMNVSKDDKQLG